MEEITKLREEIKRGTEHIEDIERENSDAELASWNVMEVTMERRVFKIFPLTSSLFLFVYFLSLSFIFHRQKRQFRVVI